ncbi:MAG: 3-dehydroquinate synthase II [Candidatus Tectomicrobia bacterium]|uniref:3-dehydroquinate synthase II n=1 Tax=Tectimicrobiota bacterium TaxID=2528274 RepID=A0A933GLG2_UNCTE|nr:3-dehydroquinate synthase II [Candidatus Tectomicrobia bacterium]
MGKKLWVSVRPWRKEIFTTALESGADAVLIPKECNGQAKELGIIQTISEDGDMKLGQDVVEWTLSGKEDELKIADLPQETKVIIKTTDWTIIPLENLIAQRGHLYAQVNSAEEARTALSILEKGVEGVLLSTENPQEIRKTAEFMKQAAEKVELCSAKVVQIRPLYMGARVCVDTCSLMNIGQGLLVGNSSMAMFLVHSESLENPYVSARPFRVNAGPVHAYVKVPGGKTRYLSELKAGDEVLIVDYQGNTEIAIVGRVKIERRPLVLLEAEVEGVCVNIILQNAETIRLTSPEGKAISIVNLKRDDQVLVSLERSARHFGHKVDETLLER